MKLAVAIREFIDQKDEYRDHNHQLDHFSNAYLETAIDDAVFGRYIGLDGMQAISNHYWKAYETVDQVDRQQWPSRLYEARTRLLNIKQDLKNKTDFEALYATIRNTLEVPKIKYLADLYYYDVALRIGFALKPKLLPSKIFVQSGSERGAKDILGSDIYEALKANNPYIDPQQLYETEPTFNRLEVHQIESFLCVMKDEIKAWKRQNS